MSVAKCDRCGVDIFSMAEVGYMGPIDRSSTRCSPFEAFITMCLDCYHRDPGWRPKGDPATGQ